MDRAVSGCPTAEADETARRRLGKVKLCSWLSLIEGDSSMAMSGESGVCRACTCQNCSSGWVVVGSEETRWANAFKPGACIQLLARVSTPTARVKALRCEVGEGLLTKALMPISSSPWAK